jgi:NitT/TauT family transport system permease protein
MSGSAIILLVLWQVLATLLFDPGTFPTPVVVWADLLTILENGGPQRRSALLHVRISLGRVLTTIAITMTLAVIIGILMGVSESFEAPMARWLPFWMTAPTVVVLLVTMIIFNFSEVAVIITVVFGATPYAAIPIWKAMEQIDQSLLDMAGAFKLSKLATLRHVYLPSILPSAFASLRYLVGTAWKVVVLAEVFGRSEGLGAMFRFYYQRAEIGSLLAYMALFLVVIFLIEYAIVHPVERHAFRWRD